MNLPGISGSLGLTVRSYGIKGDGVVKSIYVYRHRNFFRKMELAKTFEELQRGLLGRTTAGSGIFLMGATSIHTFGMRFPIDVVYLSANGIVLAIEERLLPNQQGKTIFGVAHIVELNAGNIRRYRIKVGERWAWRMV